ncbi:MAG: hypothetical protein JXE06_05070 [Coriobacteriia bacterium]|nr:hypothetical protein [Coriobacteriia bacterium]MBN2821694.1 hypothetical protein [Coriobacteriia bacterium]
MRDAGLLLWLRWRHLRGRIRFWAAIGGADLETGSLTNRLYAIYLSVVCAIWLYLMWASATDIVFEMGLADVAARGLALRVLAFVPLAAFAFLGARALRSSPVKFTFQDMAYVAGTPLDRGVLALLDCVRETVPIALVVGLVDFLVAVALTRVDNVHLVIGPALTSALAVAAAVAAANLLAWLLGLMRMTARRGRTWPGAVWLVPVVVLALGIVLEDAGAWLGAAIVSPLDLGSAPASLGALVALSLAALVAIPLTGRRLDTIRVVDESGLYAQLQVFRPLAIYDSRAVRDITRRKKLAARKPVGKLPAGVGPWALVARAWVAHLRQPSSLLTPLLWGAALVPSAVVLSLEPRPILMYFPWFFAVLVAPAENLVHVFREEIDRPSLRELLPFDNLKLLTLEGLPALMILCLSSVAFWLVETSPAPTPQNIVLSLLLGVALFFCRGLEHVRILNMKRPLGFPVTAGVTSVAILAASAGGSLVSGVLVAVVCVILLGSMLAASEI